MALILGCTVMGCGGARGSGADEGAATGVGEGGASSEDSGGADGGAEDGGPTVRLDASSPEQPEQPEACTVSHDPDAIDGFGPCETPPAPPESFMPELQWSYDGADGEDMWSVVTPLVANLTDDDGDGFINLCDKPDIVVVATVNRKNERGFNEQARRLLVLDGETGKLHKEIPHNVSRGTPAIADLDEDGIPEIIAVQCEDDPTGPTCAGDIAAFHADGEMVWRGDAAPSNVYGCAIAVANVDNEGGPEILCTHTLFDHTGTKLVQVDTGVTGGFEASASVLADMDGDGDMEVVLPHSVAHHDGTVLWANRASVGAYAYPQVADLDGDQKPEVLITTSEGVSLYEHDGRLKFRNQRATGAPAEGLNWARPAAIHDFDGDGNADFSLSSGEQYSVFKGDGSLLWTADVVEISGIATGTAFDFLGDGTAEAMYGDEGSLWVYDETGTVLFETPRTSGTVIEYPVVADVDNDGSAEIVVVSEHPGRGFPDLTPDDSSPMVQVVREIEDRWIQPRRIWNQHTYHVTNVREDGSIPVHEDPHWLSTNTFRTNAQIENGGVCRPTPQG